MAKSNSLFLIKITDEAISNISPSIIDGYIHIGHRMICKKLIIDYPFCRVVALPSKKEKSKSELEFYLPYQYVSFAVVAEDEQTAIGYTTEDEQKQK
jgi:hypothetical protein